MTSIAAFLLVLGGALLAGRSLGPLLVGAEDRPAFRGAIALSAGLLALHVVMAWLDLAGVPWHALAVAATVAAGALVFRWRVGPAPTPLPAGILTGEAAATAALPGAPPAQRVGSTPRWTLDWATLVAATLVAFFAVLAVSQRIAFPDFVYHWGIKGHRYFLGRGIDYDFLGRDWNLVAHRDYPQLVPELYALQSLVARRFSEPMLLLWSAVFYAALLVAARAALDAWAVRETWQRVAVALLALAIGVFAVGHLMAGSVDWIVAFALTAALPSLYRPLDARGELQLGVLAALAASSKLEGIPLAVLLVGAGAWRCWRASRLSLGAVLRLAGPSIVAVAPWLIQGFRHDLFRDPQSGAFEIGRATGIAAAVWQAMLRPEWHLVPLVLFLLPLLFVRRETRLAAAVVTLQLGGYLLRYFTASFDYQFSVLSSFPRLMFHVLPAVVVGLTVVADRWGSRVGTGSGRTARRSRLRLRPRSGSAAS